MPTGVELATAWIRIVPSVDGIQGAVSKELDSSGVATSSGKAAGKGYVGGVKGAVGGLGAVLGSAFVISKVTDFFGDSIAAVSNWQTLNAQTAATVKATGGAAGVAAEDVNKLALALEATTATQAESIQSGANMLLTFKNIKNEVGEGNDIFNQATTSLVDYATVMKTDPSTAAITLGKALNDPIKGISALSRAGVSFTDDQKAMIKTLVESGDTMGAQKIILAELNGEFGGSGAARADTYAGKLFAVKDAFGDMGEAVVTALIPGLMGLFAVLTPIFTFLGQNQAVLIALATFLGGVLVIAMYAWVASIWAANVALLANPVTWIVLAIVALVAALIWVATQTTFFQDVWTAMVGWITAVLDGFFGWWNSFWAGFSSFLSDTWNNIVLFVTTYINTVLAVITAVGAAISAVWNGFWNGIIGFFKGAWATILGVVNTIRSVFASVFNAIAGIVRGAFNGVVGVVKGVINGVIGVVNGVIGGINSVAGAIGGVFGVNLSIGMLPYLAKGGVITGAGSVIVGERGPELLRLPKGASVDPDISGVNGNGGLVWNGDIYTTQQASTSFVEEVRNKQFLLGMVG